MNDFIEDLAVGIVENRLASKSQLSGCTESRSRGTVRKSKKGAILGAGGRTVIAKKHVEERETPSVENLTETMKPHSIIQ
jgi:hypothetical protein